MNIQAVEMSSLFERRFGLAPVYDAATRILVLGSFPSPASLLARQYYGHPQNQFWRLMGAMIDAPLHDLPYLERLDCLLRHGIGIWDVYQSCVRPGALDADIRAGKANDFSGLLHETPRLARFCFNGRTAARFAPRLVALAAEAGREVTAHVLPSSSPVYTLSFAQKRERWREGGVPPMKTLWCA
ncbi:MAG: DNA-deoxyinosine glycosylase [Zoogloeaceae bacterium]|jgi:hypoxanthine-DNA glycosylase|nr:DNA-deoxyinosine glycosylase [Zoogloeaceae bacterium]